MNIVPANLIVNTEFESISMIVDLAEEIDGKIKYRIRLRIESTEFIIYRGYKQFKYFYHSLKSDFPRLELSSFPSKFSLINKKETRRKAFNKFLLNLKEIGLRLEALPKNNLKRLMIDFFSERKSNLIEETLQPKDEIVEKAQIRPNLGSMMGFVDLKLGDEDWINYYASLIHSDIYFFPNDNDTYFTIMVNVSGADITESDFEEVIELHHPYEKTPILLRAKNWAQWKDSLVVESGFSMSSTQTKIKSNGRVVVKIYTGQNIKLMKPAVSVVKPHVFVRISLGDLVFQTSVIPQEYLASWNQTFIM